MYYGAYGANLNKDNIAPKAQPMISFMLGL